MDELPFKIVRMHGPRDEVIALVENLLICKAAFEKALFVYPGCPLGNASGREDHSEVERGPRRLKKKSPGGYRGKRVWISRARKLLRDISYWQLVASENYLL
jgi:hypothetical protein